MTIKNNVYLKTKPKITCAFEKTTKHPSAVTKPKLVINIAAKLFIVKVLNQVKNMFSSYASITNLTFLPKYLRRFLF